MSLCVYCKDYIIGEHEIMSPVVIWEQLSIDEFIMRLCELQSPFSPTVSN